MKNGKTKLGQLTLSEFTAHFQKYLKGPFMIKLGKTFATKEENKYSELKPGKISIFFSNNTKDWSKNTQ